MATCWVCRNFAKGPQPALYLWHYAATGNNIPLCVECCAAWRRNAHDDPSLRPTQIQMIGQASEIT